MTVVTSPQGRQRIVVHETKVIWFFTNISFLNILSSCIKRPSAANGPFCHARSHIDQSRRHLSIVLKVTGPYVSPVLWDLEWT